ncbi:uncharacterized protein LOC111058595 [Nilaparvata lugens]|uniref:uncharacterized protein LOC111058595 n=1 Tax=Nilaparvata lugens TaxID=108931 RepID=UPI00193DD76A|nr:uncharacterized protein LOC111058595 [Nilaparvata lugens]
MIPVLQYTKKPSTTDESGAISDDDSRNYDKVLGKKSVHETIYFSYQNVLSQADLPNHILTSNEKIYRVPFRLLGVAEYSFILLVVLTRTGLTVVNLCVLEDKTIIDCYSVAFNAASFISMSKSADVASKFNNLRYFSILFKNRIALKGRCLVLNKYKLLNNSLEGMPVEILLKIIKYLTIDDQEKVASLSSTLYSKTTSFL